MATKEKLLTRLENERASLLNAIDGLDEETIATAPACGEWTIKDVVGHVVSWGDEFRSEIRAIGADPTPAYDYVIREDDEYGEWNGRQAAGKKLWTWSRMREDLDRDYGEMVALVDGLSEEDLSKRGVVPWLVDGQPPPYEVTQTNTSTAGLLVRIHCMHMSHHTEGIADWRAHREGKGAE